MDVVTAMGLDKVRALAGYLRHVSEPEDALEQVADLAAAAQAVIFTLIWDAREAGATWPQVGRAFGISPQAAQQRFGTRPE